MPEHITSLYDIYNKPHWGNDSCMVRDRVAVRWTELGPIEK